jgi:hypothetical protein
MNEYLQQAQNYIQKQLGSGQSPDEIAQQLRAAGWQDDLIQQAFTGVQAQVMPTVTGAPNLAPATTTSTPTATDNRHGRLRTGWRLFTTSWSILRGNKYLLRYLFMTGLWVFAITTAFVAIYIVLEKTVFVSSDPYNDSLTPVGYAFVFFDYLLIYFFINLYAAGLTANVLDIFNGNKKTYRDYMHIAWSKAPALLVFSIASATVGMFLRLVVERIRFIGWIIAWLLGTAWSLGTLFVVPIIVTEETPNGLSAIKKSVGFFKQTWGEGITTKATVNIPIFLIQLALFGLFIPAIFLAAIAFSYVGMFVVAILYIILSLTFSIIGSFANSLVNIALFYYATKHQVPPAFNEALLNQVFIKRRSMWFQKKPTPPSTV